MSAQSTDGVTQAATTDPIAWTGLGRLRGMWYRIRFTVQEMNYAARRVTEVQAPWIADEKWHSR
jgi:hypothetical protein